MAPRRKLPTQRDPSLGEALKDRRGQLGWSQADAADAIGMSQANYNRVELGSQDPGAEHYEALCDFLDVDFRELAYLIATGRVRSYRRRQETR